MHNGKPLTVDQKDILTRLEQGPLTRRGLIQFLVRACDSDTRTSEIEREIDQLVLVGLIRENGCMLCI
jgi:hypothetical protein